MTTVGNERHRLHLDIAEAGKVHALGHRHAEALRHYREAIRLAVAAKAPEVFFRHYAQCALESLELMASYDEVIRFCEEADRFHRQMTAGSPTQRRDHAAILERLGLVRIKAGQPEAGIEALRRAIALAGPGALPAAEDALAWLDRRLAVTPERVLASQKRHRYFTVRADQVDRSRARPLPADTGTRSPNLGLAPTA